MFIFRLAAILTLVSGMFYGGRPELALEQGHEMRESGGSAAAPRFDRIEAVMKKRCTPCHFSGGTMHAKLPFDRPETIVHLNAKLLKRIKDPAEQKLIREFIAQSK